jgi:type II secretory pathway pseudopilin PulG
MSQSRPSRFGVARHAAAACHVSGVTIVELLIVVALILMLSAVTLKTLAPSMAYRQIREATRMVNVFFASARSRAIETGRPTGVWIDRMPGLPEAAVSLSYAQVPDPYTGDFADSGLQLLWIPPMTSTNYGRVQYFALAAVPVAAGGQANIETWSTADPKVQSLVRPGDQIRINYGNLPFTLYTASLFDPIGSNSNQLPAGIDKDRTWIVGVKVNKSALTVSNFNLGTNPTYGTYLYNDFSSQGNILPPATAPGASIPYQILRQPTKSAAGGIQLPDGAIIDLNYSGLVPYVNGNNNQQGYAFCPRQLPGTANYGYVGNQIDNNGVVIPASGTSPAGPDTSPIIIMFDTTGAVEQVYCRFYNALTQRWDWRGVRSYDIIYLLIGKSEKVPVTAQTPAAGEVLSNIVKYNIADESNFWVALNSRNGVSAIAEVLPPRVNAELPANADLTTIKNPSAFLNNARGNVGGNKFNVISTTGGK